MDMVPRSWYIQKELERKTVESTHMSSHFLSTFCFIMADMAHREALHKIKEFIFHWQPKDIAPWVVCSYHQAVEKLKEFVHCWKTDVDNIDDDGPHGI
jgi:hypothetical protein